MSKNIQVEISNCLGCTLSKCQSACPLNMPISEITNLLKKDKLIEAFKINYKYNPLGSICGLVCPKERRCESRCILNQKSKGVKFGLIENDIWQKIFILNLKENINLKDIIDTGKINELNIEKSFIEKSKIAIIGGGPAGIALSNFLSRYKIKSTIYEKENYLGGIMMYGIPNFRLEKELIKNTLDLILDNSYTQIKLNKKLVSQKSFLETNKISNKNITESLNKLSIENQSETQTEITIEDLFKQGYKYIVLSIGLGKSKKLELNSNTNKIITANEFLKSQTQGNINKDLISLNENIKNKKVIVIGGGNVAIDSARTAKKLGADVTIVYRRKLENMPANKEEIEEEFKENIEFIFETNIKNITEENNIKTTPMIKENKIEENKIEKTITEKTNIKATLIDKESNIKEINCDYIIEAIGSEIQNDYINKEIKIENGKILVDKNFETTYKNVFAIGDIISNENTIADAVKDAKDLSNYIINSLKKHKKIT